MSSSRIPSQSGPNHDEETGNEILNTQSRPSEEGSLIRFSDNGNGYDNTNGNANGNDDTDNDTDSILYKNYPLAKTLNNGSRKIRKDALRKKGKWIDRSVKSNARWLRTIFVCRERAFDKFFTPWAIATINTIAWSVVMHIYKDKFILNLEQVTSLYNLVLTTALAFLLVFRLNRVAIRWWDTRTMWGTIVADARILTSCILEHTNHAPTHRDDAISWLAVMIVSIKQHLRDDGNKFNNKEVAGFISPEKMATFDVKQINHPCLYLAANIRHSLKRAYIITADTPPALGFAYSSEMRMMEKYIDQLIFNMGGLERVKSTPLPMVFVTHLRTFLMVYLLTMPYLYGHLWGWGTIPAVSLTAYILLGIDGSASECESPFGLRANHLAMENFCTNALINMEDLYIENAQRRINNL